MPQITVNEIDQSVVTRVVSDDKVKILIPAILSFGPGYDSEQSSVMTFTDVSAFNRGCGYTPAEFNPFTDDYSRIYAREIMKRGGAVSVVRVNNAGETASFNIDGVSTDRTAPTINTICPAVLRGISGTDNTQIFGTGSTVSLTAYPVIPGTIKVRINGTDYSDSYNPPIYNPKDTDNMYTGSIVSGSGKFLGKINYYTGEISNIDVIIPASETPEIFYKYYNGTDSWKYTFCPQIEGIMAKYSGSFGNNLFISIAQINTTRLTESYQYANISVYYINRNINYSYNEDTGRSEITSQTVNNVTMLETKRVSTNPNDPNYFEDVEFEFIRIIPSANAREELALVWSNIEAAPESEQQYSGFPVIPIRYNLSNGLSSYNFDANFNKTYGTDFNYSEEMVEKLKAGFKGFDGTSTSSNWTQNDVNQYLEEVYSSPRDIRKVIMTNLSTLYNDYTDPYIYDFDFISSGGFVYEEWEILDTWNQGDTVYKSKTDSYKLSYPLDTLNDASCIIIKSDESTVEGRLIPEISDNVITLKISEGGTNKPVATITTSNTGSTVAFTYTQETEEITLFVNYAYTKHSIIYDTQTDTGSPISQLTKTPVDSVISASGTVDSQPVTFTVGTNGFELLNGDDVIASISKDGEITITEDVTATVTNITYKYVKNDYPVKRADRTLPESDTYYAITPIHASMLNLVETRQDCIALFDVPHYYDRREGLIEYSRMLDTSYGTMHFPWCWVSDPDSAGNMLLMSPSYIFLYTFLSNLDNNVDSQKWFPPAGVKRATARVVKKPDFEIGSTLLNIWQNDNTARVNPIMKLKQYGYVIYGQYTCLPAIDMYTHSALESLNVRLIANVVKKKIFDVCLNLAFEPNTSTLWLKFFSQMDEFLRYMQYNEGVYAYKIVMDESTVTTDDINHLRCPGKVYIAPTRTAEFFDIDFIITEAGALFNN